MAKVKRIACTRKHGRWSIITYGYAARGQDMILGHIRDAGPDLGAALENPANLETLKFSLMPRKQVRVSLEDVP